METLESLGTLAGKGDYVLLVVDDPSQATISHAGETNFAIWYYAATTAAVISS